MIKMKKNKQSPFEENSSKEEQSPECFDNFCRKIVKEQKCSLDEFRERFEKSSLEDKKKWDIFGEASVERILSPEQSLFEFWEWFRQYYFPGGYYRKRYLGAGSFYNEILRKKLQDKDLLSRYKQKINVIVEDIKRTSLDYVDEHKREYFDELLEKEKENKDILKVFDETSQRRYGYISYISNFLLYFALRPILDISPDFVVKILSKIDCIFLVEDFLLADAIRNNIDLICEILSHIPKITNRKGEWDNKKILLPLLILTFGVHLMDVCQETIGEEKKQEEILRENIEKFVRAFKKTREKRKDCYFITRKWLLYLVSNLDKGLEDSQKITKIQIETIGSCIVDKDFREQFFNDEKGGNRKKELLLALIYTSETMDFPIGYLELFKKYILDLNNKIFIRSNELLKEHYLLSQLFVEIDKPDEQWADLWQTLYVERQETLHSKYSEYKGNTHSQYLILVGMSAVEYFISGKKSDLAINLLKKIWEALMELYLTIQPFRSENFLNTMITRYILLKNVMKESYELELDMVKNNPELISYIISNLEYNNADLSFLSDKKNILRSMEEHKFVEEAKRKLL